MQSEIQTLGEKITREIMEMGIGEERTIEGMKVRIERKSPEEVWSKI
ncbi:hypothetical protein HZA33_04055 [Candidatus Pacearchaeota archaeon]|nr:hypothetical protein [Candidatus Pacearchaeota archaeon]